MEQANALREKEQEFIDLWFADMYFSMLWMATAKGNFAPRSAYFLDRRQKKSAGSLIIGGHTTVTVVIFVHMRACFLNFRGF